MTGSKPCHVCGVMLSEDATSHNCGHALTAWHHGKQSLARELLALIEAWCTSDPMRTAASAMLELRKLLLAASAGDDAREGGSDV